MCEECRAFADRIQNSPIMEPCCRIRDYICYLESMIDALRNAKDASDEYTDAIIASEKQIDEDPTVRRLRAVIAADQARVHDSMHAINNVLTVLRNHSVLSLPYERRLWCFEGASPSPSSGSLL